MTICHEKKDRQWPYGHCLSEAASLITLARLPAAYTFTSRATLILTTSIREKLPSQVAYPLLEYFQ